MDCATSPISSCVTELNFSEEKRILRYIPVCALCRFVLDTGCEKDQIRPIKVDYCEMS